MFRPSQKRPNSGFTLIELLVVIAIIAILAAILFPVFAKAREKARQTSCLSNMKPLGLGFTQYNQDYDEFMPEGNATLNQYYSGAGWAGQIYSYVKSAGVYKCPDDPTIANTAILTGDKAAAVPVSYAYNFHLSAYSWAAGSVDRFKGTTIAAMNAPASTALLSEVQGSLADVTNPNEAASGQFYSANSDAPHGNTATIRAPSGTPPGAADAGKNAMGVSPNNTYNTTNFTGQTGRHSDGAN